MSEVPREEDLGDRGGTQWMPPNSFSTWKSQRSRLSVFGLVAVGTVLSGLAGQLCKIPPGGRLKDSGPDQW